MLNSFLEQLITGVDLTEEQVALAVDYLMSADVSTEKKSALLVLLKAKGETVDEIVGFINTFKQRMRSIRINRPLLDIAGTGGDRLKTVNLSTGSALLAATCGIFVAKHGNRAASSHCGSADVLNALNIPIELSERSLKDSIENNYFGFCFAPLYHPVFKDLKPLRVSLGIPTILNFLGPLLNPANAEHYVLGVSSKPILSKFAEILLRLKVKKSVVIHCRGMDEISTVAVTQVAEIDDQNIHYYTIDPKDFDLPYCELSELQAHSIEESKNMLIGAFNGAQGPVSDSLALNAGMGLYVYGKCPSLLEGFHMAKENLKNGAVMDLIQRLSLKTGEKDE